MTLNRRQDDPKPAPVLELPAPMKLLRAAIDEHFPLLQSLDWRTRGRALEEFDKRTGFVDLNKRGGK